MWMRSETGLRGQDYDTNGMHMLVWRLWRLRLCCFVEVMLKVRMSV